MARELTVLEHAAFEAAARYAYCWVDLVTAQANINIPRRTREIGLDAAVEQFASALYTGEAHIGPRAWISPGRAKWPN